MSDRTKYRSSVKNWLIRSFRWWPHRANTFVHRNDPILDELRASGLSPFKAAEFINVHHNR